MKHQIGNSKNDLLSNIENLKNAHNTLQNTVRTEDQNLKVEIKKVNEELRGQIGELSQNLKAAHNTLKNTIEMEHQKLKAEMKKLTDELKGHISVLSQNFKNQLNAMKLQLEEH